MSELSTDAIEACMNGYKREEYATPARKELYALKDALKEKDARITELEQRLSSRTVTWGGVYMGGTQTKQGDKQ